MHVTLHPFFRANFVFYCLNWWSHISFWYQWLQCIHFYNGNNPLWINQGFDSARNNYDILNYLNVIDKQNSVFSMLHTSLVQ